MANNVYNPHKTMIKGYLKYISKEIDSYSSNMIIFFYQLILTLNLLKKLQEVSARYIILKTQETNPHQTKPPTNPSCVDLITNKPKSFQNYCTLETALSNFHKVTLILLKLSSEKQKLGVINFCYTRFFLYAPQDFVQNPGCLILRPKLVLELLNWLFKILLCNPEVHLKKGKK